MPLGEALDDDYVINLLKRDAEASKKNYAATGFGSVKPRQANAPKPNTRFLRNIIRETDSHNSALKLREEAESRARLRDLGTGKRRREEEELEGSSKRQRGQVKPGRWASVLGRVEKPSVKLRENESKDQRRRDPPNRSPGHKRQDQPVRRDDLERGKHEQHAHSRPRSRSPHRHEKHPTQPSRTRHRLRSKSPQPETRSESRGNDSDSDPLEDIIGPKPASQKTSRGRGAPNTSAMDARFDPAYNPKTDVHLSDHDDDTSDWDMALEALRDRTKWRAQGGERLRAAGFGEEAVKKWQGGYPVADRDGGEKDLDSVRWRKKGEAREWDRGKVLDDETGTVDIRPEWGRLKGS